MSDDPGIALTCPLCGCQLHYDATWPPGAMFDDDIPVEVRRLRQTHVYRCEEHGIFHLKSDGRLTAAPAVHR